MAVEFIDGFDHYATQANIKRKWDPSSSTTAFDFVAGRFGGGALSCTGNTGGIFVNLTATPTRVVGFAARFTGLVSAANAICSLMDSGTTQVELRITTTGALQVTRNGTQIGISATGVINISTWYYIEFKALINSSGSFEVRVAGTTVLTGTGNTQNSGSASCNQVYIQGPNGITTYFDDLYIVNTSGSVNNDFLGECRIFTNMPVADDSSYKQWTPSAGTDHFANVDDPGPDDDATYNSSSTVGQIDLHSFSAISPVGPVIAVQSVLCARKDDASARQICEQCRSGSTNYNGANTFTMISTYKMYREIRETDPATSTAWTVSGVNAAEFGAKVLA